MKKAQTNPTLRLTQRREKYAQVILKFTLRYECFLYYLRADVVLIYVVKIGGYNMGELNAYNNEQK